ncbi:MAG: hypothetical protein ACRDRX_22345 [Pseudonocardiaceae bacterium]
MLLVSPEGTEQTRTVGMNAPDTSDIDLDPANFRCPADLWYCLDQLYNRIGRPPYSELSKRTGEKLPTSTISDLIGKNSKTSTNTSRPSLRSVELFVLACRVPETELEDWEAAWKASVAQDKPAWPEERKQLLAKIDQLTADLTEANTRANELAAELAEAKARIDELTTAFATAETRIGHLTSVLAAGKAHSDQLAAAVEAAEARATNAETALTVYHQSAPSLPAPIEQLRIRAQTYYDAHDHANALKFYGQIAAEVKREYGPGHIRTLQAQHKHLEVEIENYSIDSFRSRYLLLELLYILWFCLFKRRKLRAHWKRFICESQKYLPEGSRSVLELRLEHIYWVATVIKPSSSSLSHARKLLIALHADCKLLLPTDDPLTAQVARYLRDRTIARPVRLFQYDGAELGS